jgi:hypothetical protein
LKPGSTTNKGCLDLTPVREDKKIGVGRGLASRGSNLCLLPTGAKRANARCRRRVLLDEGSFDELEEQPQLLRRSLQQLLAAPTQAEMKSQVVTPRSNLSVPALFMKFRVDGIPVMVSWRPLGRALSLLVKRVHIFSILSGPPPGSLLGDRLGAGPVTASKLGVLRVCGVGGGGWCRTFPS